MIYAIITLILSVIAVDFSFFIYDKIKILYDRFASHKFLDDDLPF